MCKVSGLLVLQPAAPVVIDLNGDQAEGSDRFGRGVNCVHSEGESHHHPGV